MSVCLSVFVFVVHVRTVKSTTFVWLSCYQIILIFLVDSPTKKLREAQFSFFRTALKNRAKRGFFSWQRHGQYSSAHRIWVLQKQWIEVCFFSGKSLIRVLAGIFVTMCILRTVVSFLSRKNNTFWKNYHERFLSTAVRTRNLRIDRPNATTTRLFGAQQHVLVTRSNNYLYMNFNWVSTPIIELICTRRRCDRWSMWGHTLFLSELNFL